MLAPRDLSNPRIESVNNYDFVARLRSSAHRRSHSANNQDLDPANLPSTQLFTLSSSLVAPMHGTVTPHEAERSAACVRRNNSALIPRVAPRRSCVEAATAARGPPSSRRMDAATEVKEPTAAAAAAAAATAARGPRWGRDRGRRGSPDPGSDGGHRLSPHPDRHRADRRRWTRV